MIVRPLLTCYCANWPILLRQELFIDCDGMLALGARLRLGMNELDRVVVE